MAVIDQWFGRTAIPGWMSRTRGRKYVEICTIAIDVLVEGIQQARLALLGHDPPPDAIPHASRDRGIVAALTELPRDTALRFRRWLWSWRAAGLAGVADTFIDGANGWIALGGAVPTPSGLPTEEGAVLRISVDGVIGTPGITFQISTDGGATFNGLQPLLAETNVLLGDLTLTFKVGDVIPSFDLPIWHGGRGLVLNDLGAPDRADAMGSPAGDESLLHEIAQIVGACKIQLIDANGTWWTREADGYTWRLSGGPFAWEAVADADPEQWSRGIIVITNPPNVVPWEVLGADAHSLGEDQATYGTTAPIEWWNRYSVTVGNFKPANMLILATILNFDSTKFDPSDASTCPQSNWYHSHELSGTGIIWTRPVEYAWFSNPM